MIEEVVAKYLEDNGIGTRASNLFIDEIPVDKEDSVMLVAAPSPEPNKALEVYTLVLDFWSRFKNTNKGANKLQDVMDLLHQGQNYALEGFHVYFSNALGMVEYIDRDDKRRALHKLSIRFIFRKD